MGFAIPGAGGGGSGGNGLSAYEIAVQLGFSGSIEEWEASLRGGNGLSAYEIAVANGFSGTQAQWLASLKGIDGLNGSDFDPSSSAVVIRGRILYDQTSGADYVSIKSSGNWAAGRDTLLALAKAMRPASEAAKLTIHNVKVTFRTIGGGAGGAYGGYQPHGGFPGIVTDREFFLSDLPATSIPYVVGGGGSAGNPGGQTSVGGVGDRWRTLSASVSRGGNDPAEHGAFDALNRGFGLDPGLPILSAMAYLGASTSSSLAWSSARGPGGGGTAARNAASGSGVKMWSPWGGAGSRLAACNPTNGGSPNTNGAERHGSDCNPLYFDSMGGGGAAAVSSSYSAGNGGFPGAGGGSGHPDGSSTWAGGGGNGEIRLQFTALEIVKT
jgi:hypothetical protein